MNIYQPIPPADDDCDLDAIVAAHNPNREPWASMSLDALHEALRNAKTQTEAETINQFILDRASLRQLETINHATALATFLIGEYDAFGNGQCRYLCEVAGRMAAEITKGMPARGTPQECN